MRRIPSTGARQLVERFKLTVCDQLKEVTFAAMRCSATSSVCQRGRVSKIFADNHYRAFFFRLYREY
jgi:hypothetical protein